MSAPHATYDRPKRAGDLVCALLLLLLLSPVLVAVGVSIALTMGFPILFRQDRPGKDERVFTLLKFRTMRAAPADVGDVAAIATDVDRLTPLGKFLRSTSLDELPQLFNILVGDMSFVGPRPLLIEYLGHYTSAQARRHEVRPGITGLAQVSGRNAVSWEQRLALDVRYVDERSFLLDARIVWRTLVSILKREGISEEGAATMTPFVEAKKPTEDNGADMGRSAASGDSRGCDETDRPAR